MDSVPRRSNAAIPERNCFPADRLNCKARPSARLPALPKSRKRAASDLSCDESLTPGGSDGGGRYFGGVSALAPAMKNVAQTLMRLAPTELTVTLTGETGTGKDVLAHALHELSNRALGPFIVFDCGAIAQSLAESELFGHERGAFTGAHSVHSGAFERAQRGTLFLDEIGELPLDLQPRLLRALESRRIRRVGGTEDRGLDARIIAATNRDLPAEVAAGRFRQDLFFRLGSAVIPVPPLRERLEDLPALVGRLLADLGRGDIVVYENTLAVLRSHSWPGNVRELKNALACASAFVDPRTRILEPEHVRATLRSGGFDASDIDRLPLGGQRLDRIERAAIMQTLAQADGNKIRAAQTLGIAVSTLYGKLRKYQQEESDT